MAAQPDYTDLDGDEFFSVLWPSVKTNFQGCATWFYSDDGTAPSVTFPLMLWADGNAGYVKQRNEGDTGWVVVGKLVTGSDGTFKLGGVGLDITAGAEGGSDDIDFTINVVSPEAGASATRIKGRRLVIVTIATSTFGAPGGTQTVTVSTGTEIADLGSTGDQVLLCETDADGQLVIEVVVSGAATRYLRATCGDSEPEEQSATWA